MYPSVPICLVHRFLTFCYLSGQICIQLRQAKPFHILIVTTSGYLKEFTHNRHRVFVPVTIDNRILYLWSHFLSTDCRKSRNNLFSICNLAISR